MWQNWKRNTLIRANYGEMRKTKRTELTDEVRLALLELKEIPWRQLPLTSAGYTQYNFPGVRRVLMNSMLNIEFIAKFMYLCGKTELVTEHISIQVIGDDCSAMEQATFNLKTNIAAKKPEDMAWRELALEYGYNAASGSFSRGIKGRQWAPVEMMYLLCKRFHQKEVSGEHNGVKLILTINK